MDAQGAKLFCEKARECYNITDGYASSAPGPRWAHVGEKNKKYFQKNS
jgi:hypothetical protein